MTFTSILVHAEPDAAASPRLACAVAVAERFDALLMGVGAELLQSTAVADPFGMLAMEWQGVMRQQLEDNLKAAEQTFRLHAGSLRTDWRTLYAPPTDALCGAARAADLIVAGGAPLTGADYWRQADTAELAIRAGRPVLVAPPTHRTFHGDRILVAWKDTREARRAVADAMPFLKRAEAVVVMEVCTKDQVEAAEFHTSEVVAHLKRHGVEASAKVEVEADDRACVELNIQAQAMAADLIVAGCYGHSRMREWVMGGVSRGLIQAPERFVLLSH
ncbi:MAG: universal stress protein [Phenylobacterium sp.]|uniref:universal stress protein n=1 Tax=Phenylobacterium sp. TaxID=1871053 RepID=UPI0027334D37|nr:universal stress protein [Phenylobacterium sp.]MDP3749018.1 universal stress protein [Phenylobacterium sp.]